MLMRVRGRSLRRGYSAGLLITTLLLLYGSSAGAQISDATVTGGTVATV